MPIKGLKRNTQTPGLARAGVIRLGYKAKKCKKCSRITEPLDAGPNCPACDAPLPTTDFPRESPHFILKDAAGVAEAIGTEAPTELKIYFPFDDVGRVFPHYMQQWSASSLRCRGDGELILHAINPQTGKTIVRDGVALEDFSEGKQEFKAGMSMACPGLDRNLYPKCEHCKPNAMLIIMLRDVPRLAYYQISTTSIHNISNIPDQLEYVREQVRRLTGEARISGVPFILRRVKRTVSAPKTDKKGNPTGRMRTDKYFLELEIEPEWIAKMIRGIARLADNFSPLTLPPTEQQELLPAGPAPASHFDEPPEWEPRPDDEEDVAEIIEVEPVQGAGERSFNSLDDLLFQLNQEYGVAETDAKAQLKALGFKSLPKNGGLKKRLAEMYAAFVDNLPATEAEEPEQAAFDELEAAFPRDAGYAEDM